MIKTATSQYITIFLLLTSLLFSLLIPQANASSRQSNIQWEACFSESGLPFECATVFVPLNHQTGPNRFFLDENIKPNTPKVGIAMIRLPASNQESRKGSLFVNPGGPGVSGVDFILNLGSTLFTPEVQQNFDIIGFDPRGTNRSDALVCFEDFSELDSIFSQPFFPTTDAQIASRKQAQSDISDLCAIRAGDIINHMSTADVARDLNLLRRAVGDRKLNYVGYSYGSHIGTTYANLFPHKVGSVVLDGVIDSVAWTTGRHGQAYKKPYSTRLRSDKGAMKTLNEFFRLCDEGGERCSFSGNSATRFNVIAEIVRQTPIIIDFPGAGPIPFDYTSLIAFTNSALGNSVDWPFLADILLSLEIGAATTDSSETPVIPTTSSGFSIEDSPIILQPVWDAAVACSDSDNPSEFNAWALASEKAEANFGYFGPLRTWESSLCQSWPGSKNSRYRGPFYTWTRNPILIVNTLFDPATRYRGAKKVNRLLFNSRLLTIDGWGHLSLFLSECATQAISDYLVNDMLPKRGSVCRQDTVPFGGTYTLPESDFHSKKIRSIKNKRTRKLKSKLRKRALRKMNLR